jgi:hypothetical protein
VVGHGKALQTSPDWSALMASARQRGLLFDSDSAVLQRLLKEPPRKLLMMKVDAKAGAGGGGGGGGSGSAAMDISGAGGLKRPAASAGLDNAVQRDGEPAQKRPRLQGPEHKAELPMLAPLRLQVHMPPPAQVQQQQQPAPPVSAVPQACYVLSRRGNSNRRSSSSSRHRSNSTLNLGRRLELIVLS